MCEKKNPKLFLFPKIPLGQNWSDPSPFPCLCRPTFLACVASPSCTHVWPPSPKTLGPCPRFRRHLPKSKLRSPSSAASFIAGFRRRRCVSDRDVVISEFASPLPLTPEPLRCLSPHRWSPWSLPMEIVLIIVLAASPLPRSKPSYPRSAVLRRHSLRMEPVITFPRCAAVFDDLWSLCAA